MNTVMMYQVLRRARKGLNLIIVGTYTLKAFGLSALASGILIIITRWLGWSGANFLGWLLFTCSGGLLGLAIGFGCKRWNEAAVARWVDTRFGFQDSITAALICIERDCSGLLDQAIVERAQQITTGRLQFHWPLSGFYRQTIQTVILTGVTLLALIFIPAQLEIHFQPPIIIDQITNNYGTKSRNPQKPPVSKPLSSREIAKMLFPQDPKLMALGEKAILAGDMDALRELLRQAMLNSDSTNLDRSAQASNEDPIMTSQSQLMQSLISANSMDDVQNIMDQNQERQSKQPESGNQDRERSDQELTQRKSKQSQNGRNQSQQNEGNQSDPHNQNPNEQLGTYAYNSTLPGQGEGVKVDSNSKIIPQSDPHKKPIILTNKGGFFEYLLPGKDSRVPLAGVLPGAAQASEQALSRQGVPGEYADFTRSYFLKLSQSITGSSPESEGKP